nr:hypothetical transcript [Hymenolepis microstoma]
MSCYYTPVAYPRAIPNPPIAPYYGSPTYYGGGDFPPYANNTTLDVYGRGADNAGAGLSGVLPASVPGGGASPQYDDSSLFPAGNYEPFMNSTSLYPGEQSRPQ